MKTLFRDLSIGQSFDWINDTAGAYNSFYDRCEKTGPRTYKAERGGVSHTVGSINATVFHVEPSPN